MKSLASKKKENRKMNRKTGKFLGWAFDEYHKKYPTREESSDVNERVPGGP